MTLRSSQAAIRAQCMAQDFVCSSDPTAACVFFGRCTARTRVSRSLIFICGKRSMREVCRNSAIGLASWWLCAAHAIAMSQGPIPLDIKQIDGKPAACLPMSDEVGSDPIQVRGVDVDRRTGPVSPVVMYWALEIPASAKPVYLKPGECLVYGQTVAGAIVHVQPKTLDVNKFYSVSIVPGGDYGPVYSSSFCVLKQADGGIHIAVPGAVPDLCTSVGY